MKYKGIVIITLLVAAIISGGLWLTQFSYRQKAPVKVENLSASFTLAQPSVSGATVSSENWGEHATSSDNATPAVGTNDTKARIFTGDDGLDNIYFEVDNSQASNLWAFYDLKLKIYLSETGENLDTGWSGENYTIPLVSGGATQGTEYSQRFDNGSTGFLPNKSLDIVYEVYENTDNISYDNAPAIATIPIEIWAEEE